MRCTRIAVLVALLSLVGPLIAEAQPAGKLPIIGLLVPGTPSSHGQWFAS